MAAEQRKLLGKLYEQHELAIRPLTSQTEQLMGEQMVHGIDGQASKLKITDSKICRSYLVGTCPHDLFTNTKQDLGPCPKVHSEALKNEYEAADAEQKKRWNFEYDYMRDMQKHIDECNRRIDTAQRRLEKTPDEIRQTNTLVRILGRPFLKRLCSQFQNSYSRSMTLNRTSTAASKKSFAFASLAQSTWVLSSGTRSRSTKRNCKSVNASSRPFKTPLDRLVTKSFKSATFAVPTSADSTTIVALPITFMARCTLVTHKCARHTSSFRKS